VIGVISKMLKERIKTAFRNIRDFINYLTGYETASFTPGTQEERIQKRERFIIFIVVIGLVTLILCFFIPWERFYRYLLWQPISNESWLGFIASFWGAIAGAIIAGIATVFTTWLIIRRSYRVDYHRERMENLPILQLSLREDVLKRLRGSKNPEKIIMAEDIWYREFEGLQKESLVYEMKNIGRGIAINIHMPESSKTIVYGTVNYTTLCSGEKRLFIEDHTGYSERVIEFLFFDIFDNLYSQKFVYHHNYENETYSIDMKIPELLIKTKRIRYVQ